MDLSSDFPVPALAKIDPSRFVIISGYHDYRSKRRVNLHFIADELATRGSVFFLSLRYSYLTRLVEDPRQDLWDRSNRLETVDGVDCFLKRTFVHACRLPRMLKPIERRLFAHVGKRLPMQAQCAIAKADVIFVESGIALIFLPLLRQLAPDAEVVYMASDSLEAIKQAEPIRSALRDFARMIDRAAVPSPLLRDDVPSSVPCHYIPHGVEKAQFDRIGGSPYQPGSVNAVSVGSMLFDSAFFIDAARMFPHITFHVIGSGQRDIAPANIVVHPEMPFAKTLPFIKHAHVAIAAYGGRVEPYLTHTSMKLMQYGFLGVPAVCPEAVAAAQGRFGYRPDQPESIRAAIDAALASRRGFSNDALDWAGVTDRLLFPKRYEIAAIAA